MVGPVAWSGALLWCNGDRSLSGAKLQPDRPGIDIRARYDCDGREAQAVLDRRELAPQRSPFTTSYTIHPRTLFSLFYGFPCIIGNISAKFVPKQDNLLAYRGLPASLPVS